VVVAVELIRAAAVHALELLLEEPVAVARQERVKHRGKTQETQVLLERMELAVAVAEVQCGPAVQIMHLAEMVDQELLSLDSRQNLLQ
jgi:hypothetical protein